MYPFPSPEYIVNLKDAFFDTKNNNICTGYFRILKFTAQWKEEKCPHFRIFMESWLNNTCR